MGGGKKTFGSLGAGVRIKSIDFGGFSVMSGSVFHILKSHYGSLKIHLAH